MPDTKFKKRTVTFQSSDENLVRRIESFQKKKGLKSFVAAVRVLCEEALKMSKIVQNLK